MKNKYFISVLIVLFIVSIGISVYLFIDRTIKAESQKNFVNRMMKEFEKERELIDSIKKKLEIKEHNLKVYEEELNKKFEDYKKKMEDLKKKEDEFQKKVEAKMVNRQMIETYESIDPEQAAILMKNLYLKDKNIATLLMRKLSGKKAGKILEALIQLDPKVSTELAKYTIDYYKPKNKSN